MTHVDIIIAAILALFILNGLRKGFFREIFGLLGVLGGIIVALVGTSPLSEFLKSQLPNFPPLVFPIISFIFLFLVVYFLSLFLASSLSAATESMHLAWLNRLMGGLVSGLKGAILLSILFIAIGWLPLKNIGQSLEEKSLFYAPLKNLIPLIFHYTTEQEFPPAKKTDPSLRKTINNKITPQLNDAFSYESKIFTA